jgi:uncharacterized protein (TIGR03437 family)
VLLSPQLAPRFPLLLLPLIPILSPALAANPPVGASTLIQPDSADARRFSGVGRIPGCTAFLMRPSGSTASSPAYVMTSGHCVDLAANDVILNRAETTRTIQFGLLKDASREPLRVRSRRVLYSTMKSVDLAILELDTTLGALESEGLTPLVLGRGEAASSAAVEWAGLPSIGIPPGDSFLRTGACTASGTVGVLEWRWLWHGQIRHDCSDMSGGASGSPLIDRASGAVIGIIGTTNVGNLAPSSDGLCGRNDPCELEGGQSVWRRNSSYATPVTAAVACFDASGSFQLTAAGCGLDPGTQARVRETRLSARPGQSWNAAVTSDSLLFFRYKIFAQGSGSCADESGYGPPEAIPGRVSNPLPDREGRYFLCITAGATPVPDAAWQQPRFASVLHLRLDGTPPAEVPRFTLWQDSNGFTFIPNANLATGIAVKTDTAGTSTCADLSTYRRIYPVPWFIPGASARRLCLIVEDGAGNAGKPWEVDFENPSIFPDSVYASAGYAPGRASPGSWISIFGVNLTGLEPGSGTRVFARVSGARDIDLRVGYAVLGQVNALLPDDIPPGEAEIVVAPPGRNPVRAPFRIEAAVPGIFTADGRAFSFGAILGVAGDGTLHPAMVCDSRGCERRPIDGIREFLIYASGLGNSGPPAASFSEQPVDVLDVRRGVFPGVDQVRVRMPAELRLRGYIPIRLKAGSAESIPA